MRARLANVAALSFLALLAVGCGGRGETSAEGGSGAWPRLFWSRTCPLSLQTSDKVRSCR